MPEEAAITPLATKFNVEKCTIARCDMQQGLRARTLLLASRKGYVQGAAEAPPAGAEGPAVVESLTEVELLPPPTTGGTAGALGAPLGAALGTTTALVAWDALGTGAGVGITRVVEAVLGGAWTWPGEKRVSLLRVVTVACVGAVR